MDTEERVGHPLHVHWPWNLNMELQLNSTWVKAPDIQPQVGSGTRMEGVNDASFRNLQGRIVVDNLYAKKAILTPKVKTTIGC